MQPVWFTRASQVESSILGRLLLSGDIYVNTSYYYVSIDSRRGTYSIFVREDPYFVKIYESSPILIYTKVGNREDLLSSSSLSLSIKKITENNIELIYSTDKIQLKITFIPAHDHLSTYFELTTYGNTTINRIVIPSFNHEGSIEIIKSMKINTIFLSNYLLSFKEPWFTIKIPFNITFSSSHNYIVYPSSKNPIFTVSTVTKKLTYKTSIHFARNITNDIVITDFNNLVKDLNIRYILVIENPRLHQLLSNRDLNLELIYKKDEIWLYKVRS